MTGSITHIQFGVEIGLMAMRHPKWRTGQVVFNTAAILFPDKANTLRGTDVDPYYDDDRINDFCEALFRGINF